VKAVIINGHIITGSIKGRLVEKLKKIGGNKEMKEFILTRFDKSTLDYWDMCTPGINSNQLNCVREGDTN